MTDPKEYNGIVDKDNIKNLGEEAVWEKGIYEVQPNDILTGGEKGLANLQAQQLSNRLLWLRDHIDESVKKSTKIKSLEKLVMELYEAQNNDSVTPGENTSIMVENFNDGAEEVEFATATVSDAVMTGSTTFKATPASALHAGRCYWLEDKEHSELVQVKTIEAGGLVALSSPTEHAYVAGAKLHRSTITLRAGRGYGSIKEEHRQIEEKDHCFNGQYDVEIRKNVDFTDYGAFKISGGTLWNGRLSANAVAYGVVLDATGGAAGEWRRINYDGNDFKWSNVGFVSAVPQKTAKDFSDVRAIGIVLNATGGKSGDWKRIDIDGNDFS